MDQNPRQVETIFDSGRTFGDAEGYLTENESDVWTDSEFESLIVQAVRSRSEIDELDFDMDDLPALSREEEAAIDALARELPLRLMAGEWIVARLRHAVASKDSAAFSRAMSHLLRAHAGKAKALARRLVPPSLQLDDFDGLFVRTLVRVCRELDSFDPSTQSLKTWFLRNVSEQTANELVKEAGRKRHRRRRHSIGVGF